MAKKTMTDDEMVMEMLLTVGRKKEEIKKLKKKPDWKTNCSVSLDPDADPHKRINIKVVSDPEKIVELYAFFLEKEHYMGEAATALGLDVEPTHMASTIEEWKADLASCAALLSVKAKQAELDTLDRRVNKLVTSDQRRKMELKALAQLLD